MYLYNGNLFDVLVANVIDDVQYPAGWFIRPEARAEKGIIEVDDSAPPVTSNTQHATMAGYHFSNGKWQASWIIEDKSASMLAQEQAQLVAARKAAMNKCYADTDAVTRDAVGDRAEEYRVAEVEARSFAAANYEGDISDDVAAYAKFNPTGEVQSNQWAADQIIARADAFRGAQSQMRAKRFEFQAAMRKAQDTVSLNKVVASWDSYIFAMRAALGL